MRQSLRLMVLSRLAFLGAASSSEGGQYVQTNLVSDLAAEAPVVDPNLKNPWGMSFSGTSPFWVSNQGSNPSTLYNAFSIANGTEKGPLLTVPVIPATFTPPTGPTGQVNTAAATDFNFPAPDGTTVKAAWLMSAFWWEPAGMEGRPTDKGRDLGRWGGPRCPPALNLHQLPDMTQTVRCIYGNPRSSIGCANWQS